MLADCSLFPVYENNWKQFFVSPELVTPVSVTYGNDDPYKRREHLTQFLKVPVTIPNYMGLCRVPGQTPWPLKDEIEINSFRLESLLVTAETEAGVIKFFVPMTKFPYGNFEPDQNQDGLFNLNIWSYAFSGLAAENEQGQKIGHELFASFKEAGFDPIFNYVLDAKYNRQTNTLELTNAAFPLRTVQQLSSGTFLDGSHPEIQRLIDTIGKVTVIGVNFEHRLK